MESVSEIAASDRLPVEIPVPDYLMDHCFEGAAVFPAVETLAVTAAVLRENRLPVDIMRIFNARFDRFLPLGGDGKCLTAYVDVAHHENGALTASFVTRARTGSLGIVRTKEHAVMRFMPPGNPCDAECGDTTDWEARVNFGLSLSGERETGRSAYGQTKSTAEWVDIASERIYRELVPFGPAYHNIYLLRVSAAGAVANIRAPGTLAGLNCSLQNAVSHTLGSPFPLDAAFHAACVWGQRYAGIVAFPVGLGERRILAPTRPGEQYVAQIKPQRKDASGMLYFDMAIHDKAGTHYEIIADVRMRDVSGGRLNPPEWVRAH